MHLRAGFGALGVVVVGLLSTGCLQSLRSMPKPQLACQGGPRDGLQCGSMPQEAGTRTNPHPYDGSDPVPLAPPAAR